LVAAAAAREEGRAVLLVVVVAEAASFITRHILLAPGVLLLSQSELEEQGEQRETVATEPILCSVLLMPLVEVAGVRVPIMAEMEDREAEEVEIFLLPLAVAQQQVREISEEVVPELAV
jgi:hypothetical protein